MTDNRPIGVFDSGVGGLTVLQAIQSALPNESTIYLGDLARCPYGTRPQEEVREFATQIGDLLLDQGIKLLVVACNTATAAAYDRLCARYRLPVVGVIDPAVGEAVRVARNKKIGVVATEGTVASGAYRRAILQRAPHALVEERSASWLVPLIERGPVARPEVAAVLAPLLQEFEDHDIEVLILGCTHFPLVRDVFEAEASADVTILDSAATTARTVARVLALLGMESLGPASHRLLVTGPARAFAERAQAMFRASPLIETLETSVMDSARLPVP